MSCYHQGRRDRVATEVASFVGSGVRAADDAGGVHFLCVVSSRFGIYAALFFQESLSGIIIIIMSADNDFTTPTTTTTTATIGSKRRYAGEQGEDDAAWVDQRPPAMALLLGTPSSSPPMAFSVEGAGLQPNNGSRSYPSSPT